MTLTLKLTPEKQRALEELAEASGQSVADCAAQLLGTALEDVEEDVDAVAEAERRLESSDPSQRRTLAELRAAIFGNAPNGKSGASHA